MKDFYSTRCLANSVSAPEAIIQGLAQDQGLYTPLNLTTKQLDPTSFVGLSYIDSAVKVLGTLFPDFTPEELKKDVTSAYEHSFSTSLVAPVTSIGKNYLLELYHGPTCAFKDVALTLLPRLLTTSYKKLAINKKIFILTATSGDTGKAALEGFKDVDNTYITVLYPKVGVSVIQQRQMQTSLGANVNVIALDGNFDDCQKLIKKLSVECNDRNYAHVQISSANSINIGRLAPQIVYYFTSYAKLLNDKIIKQNDLVNFVVPTGNFGDILAGYFAKLMGCPINKLVCASNSNDVLTEFIKTGKYDRRRTFHATMSPSMDILVSSNLERLLFLMSDGNDIEVKQYMDDLQTNGYYQVNNELLKKIQATFIAYSTDEEACSNAIKSSFENDHRLIDPHTAIAVDCCKQFEKDHPNQVNIILSTASPYKFSHNVLRCLTDGVPSDEFDAMKALYELTKEPIPEMLASLIDKPIRFNTTLDTDACEKQIIEKIESLNHD